MILETVGKLVKQYKTSKSRKGMNASLLKTVDQDFLPYVCHFDPNTILTKNGELLQIIRITGFKAEASSASSEMISLRQAVREAIQENIKDNKFALWFSTIRRKKNISPRGQFNDYFSTIVNNFWVDDNKLKSQYVNELYITVIIEGLDSSLVNMESFKRSFSYSKTRKLHDEFLKKTHEKLKKVVKNILEETSDYGSKLLGLREWEGVIYSEPMRFFGKIINLYEDRYPLSNKDISDDLATHKIAFGNRELEVISGGNKKFAAMMSLKEYREVSVESLDRILQLPFEFIITQSFDFTYDKKDLEIYDYQNYILKISGDENFRQDLGIASFMEDKNDSLTDYGKLQTTVMIISESQKDLNRDVKTAMEQFGSLGFLIVREDIFAQHCFWSQLPANFSYLKRQKVINANLIGGFSSLYDFPSGMIAGGKWKNAVCVFKTVLDTPYFFNFHDGDAGHSVVIGNSEYSHNVLVNFLVTQSQKFDPKIFYFDNDHSASVFIKALNGSYFQYSNPKDDDFLILNPLSFAGDVKHKDFLVSFFHSLTLIAPDLVCEEEIAAIPQIVDQIIASKDNNIKLAIEKFNNDSTVNIYQVLQSWIGDELGFIFSLEESLKIDNKVNCFNLSNFINKDVILTPIINYLLYKIENSLDGSPVIIVFNDAWDLFKNEMIAKKIKKFLRNITQKNAVAIFTCKEPDKMLKSHLSKEVKGEFVNKIFTSNDSPNAAYKKLFELSEEDVEIIEVMEKDGSHFLLKRPDETVIIDAGFPIEIAKAFYSDEITITAMQEVINAHKEEDPDKNLTPKDWMPQFFEVVAELEKERIATEKKAALDALNDARQKKIDAESF